ncbi:MAG: hypothetical protein ACHQ1H_14175 [Nitrososphaerales archaeon]
MSRKNRDVSARRRRKQEKGLPWAYILPAIVVLFVIVVAVYVESRGPTSTIQVLPPYGNGSFPFQCLGTESVVYHVHPWLRIVINGQNVTIPGAIGLKNPLPEGNSTWGEVYGGSSSTCFEPVHTHDASGVLHIESPTNTNYTLGEFFQIWAATYQYVLVNNTQKPIVFTNTEILGFNNTSTEKVVLLVDGKPSTDYFSLVLDTLAYCGASDNATSSPCYPTASGAPAWNNGQSPYPYGTHHTIEIEYAPISSGQ